jgi:hypothetical protein
MSLHGLHEICFTNLLLVYVRPISIHLAQNKKKKVNYKKLIYNEPQNIYIIKITDFYLTREWLYECLTKHKDNNP